MGNLSTVDLLVQTGSNQLLFKLKIFLNLFRKTSCLNEEVICTEPPLHLVLPVFKTNLIFESCVLSGEVDELDKLMEDVD